MKCATCEASGERSKVYPGYGTMTAMGFTPFYDEDGVYHSHDRNITTQNWSCSNGHKWSESSSPPCPAPGCTFNATPDPLA